MRKSEKEERREEIGREGRKEGKRVIKREA